MTASRLLILALGTSILAGGVALAQRDRVVPAPEARVALGDVAPAAAAEGRFDLQSPPMTPYARDKALRLLRDRLPCLGCHQLDGEGGRIGPDLSAVGSRLRAEDIHAMIADPQGARPGSLMPRVPMPDDRVRLLASYLAERGAAGARPGAIVPAAARADLPDRPAELYRLLCASCHGEGGAGDGYNAAYLPAAPTRHADSAYMSGRPDDTLFDGIHAGGLILGRSHRMPGFGELLGTAQIRGLVRHLRALCRCEGPTWSTDGGGSGRAGGVP